MNLTICTPWWNHPGLLLEYAQAVNAGEPDEVIVIDNASDVAFDSKPLEPRTLTIRNKENLGFSRACNQGLAMATGDAVLFLNNDIRMAGEEGWAETIKEALEPGTLVGANLRSDDHASVDGKPVPYLDGWCLAGMREDLIEIGGWDEGDAEPAYYGDNDLCARAVARGFDLVQVDLPLVHLVGRSTTGEQTAAALDVNYPRYAERVRSMGVLV